MCITFVKIHYTLAENNCLIELSLCWPILGTLSNLVSAACIRVVIEPKEFKRSWAG